MEESKKIIAKVIIKNSDNEDDVIFWTLNAYDLRNHISFPYGQDKTLHKANIFIINEIEYSIEEITLDIFRPESEVLENNFQVIVYVTKVVVE